MLFDLDPQDEPHVVEVLGTLGRDGCETDVSLGDHLRAHGRSFGTDRFSDLLVAEPERLKEGFGRSVHVPLVVDRMREHVSEPTVRELDLRE